MLSGLEDFLHIWNRFSIPQLPALAPHQAPLLPPPSIPCLLPVFPSPTCTAGMQMLLFLQLLVFVFIFIFIFSTR